MSKNMLDPIIRALVGVPEDRLGLVLDVANRLGNKNDGDTYYSNLAAFNRNGGCMQLVLKHFAVWKTITVPSKSGAEFITELVVAGIRVYGSAHDIMGKPEFKTLKKSRIIKLAKVTLRELGFTKQPTTDELWARIQELGSELCPPETGTEIWKNHDEQKIGDACWLAMKQIAGPRDSLYVFYIERRSDGRCWFGAHYANPSNRWHLDDEVIFGLRE